jgi:hypothetical protein
MFVKSSRAMNKENSRTVMVNDPKKIQNAKTDYSIGNI